MDIDREAFIELLIESVASYGKEQQMKKIPVWFDCDTGVDDAIALILLSQLELFEVVGVSTVAGNVDLDKTTANTLRVLDLCHAPYPVFRGAAQPNDALADLSVLCPRRRRPRRRDAAGIGSEAGIHSRMGCALSGSRKICGRARPDCRTAMTNIGLTLTKYKDFPGLIKRIVIMGGAAVGGNVAPSAEFNILAIPGRRDAFRLRRAS